MMVWKAEHWLAEHWLAAIIAVTAVMIVGVAINVPRPTFAPPVAGVSVAPPAADTSSLADAQAALARMQERHASSSDDTETASVVAINFLQAWSEAKHAEAMRQCSAEAAEDYGVNGDFSANNFVIHEYSPWRTGIESVVAWNDNPTNTDGYKSIFRYRYQSKDWGTGKYYIRGQFVLHLQKFKQIKDGMETIVWKVVKSKKI